MSDHPSFLPTSPAQQGEARHGRPVHIRARRHLGRQVKIALIAFAILVVAGGVWWYRASRVERAINRLTSFPADGMIRDSQQETQGNVRLEKNGNVYKVMFTFTAPNLTAKQALHGWMYDKQTKEYRYGGVFYPVQDGQYALTYTTEEKIGRFHQALISRETLEPPAAPTDIIAGGVLPEVVEDVTIPLPDISPAATEVTPAETTEEPATPAPE